MVELYWTKTTAQYLIMAIFLRPCRLSLVINTSRPFLASIPGSAKTTSGRADLEVRVSLEIPPHQANEKETQGESPLPFPFNLSADDFEFP